MNTTESLDLLPTNTPPWRQAGQQDSPSATEHEGYCVKCEAKRPMKDVASVAMKNGKPAVQGVCPECGTKMFKIGRKPTAPTVRELRNDDPAVVALREGLVVTLPLEPRATELVELNASRSTPLNLDIPASSAHRYFLLEIPIGIRCPAKWTMTRLYLQLKLRSQRPDPPLFHSHYPTSRAENHDVELGELSVDVSKALCLIPVIGAPAADAFGLKLKVPIAWKHQKLMVQAGGDMTGLLYWDVADKRIREGFSAYAIVRSLGSNPVKVSAAFWCECRRGIAGIWTRKVFSAQPRRYTLKA